MATNTKISVGFLVLVLFATGLYITLSEDVRLRVDHDKSTFYVNENGRWLVSGREYNKLLDGASLLYRRTSGIKVDTFIDEKAQTVTIKRTTPYIRGPVVVDTYFFDGKQTDVELFPVYHTVEVFNATGFYYKYEVRDLTYDGPTFKLDGVQTSMNFGKNMKVSWWDGYRLGWVYESGSMYVKSEKIDSDYVKFDVRLFDPPATIDWVSYNSVRDGLKTYGYIGFPWGIPKPAVFQLGSDWYAIVGLLNGTFDGYKWQSDEWVKDSDIMNGLSDDDVGDNAKPSAFFMDGSWNLISGEVTSFQLNAWTWNGSEWITNSTLTTGYTGGSTDSCPTVFNFSNTWHMALGYNPGTFSGFTWNGTSWVSNSSIITGLVDPGSYSTPNAFYYNDQWNMIVGAWDGGFDGYYWNGSQWVSDSTAVDGLQDVGTTSAPEVFSKDSGLYLLSSSQDGWWFGYKNDTDPVIVSSTILPASPTSSDNLIGYCNATDADGDNLTYNFKWYKDGILYSIGVTANETRKLIPDAYNENYTSPVVLGNPGASRDGNFSSYSWNNHNLIGNIFFYENYTWRPGMENGITWHYKMENQIISTHYVDFYCWNYTSNSYSLVVSQYGPVGVQDNNVSVPSKCIYENYPVQLYIHLRGYNSTNSARYYESELIYNETEYYSQGVEANVNNISSSETSGEEIWILSCQASDGRESSWLNSSSKEIEPNAPIMQSARIAPDPAYTNDTLIGYCNATQDDTLDISYYYQWLMEYYVDLIEYDTFTSDGTWINLVHAYDNSWGSYAYIHPSFGDVGNVSFNYSRPSADVVPNGAIWQVKSNSTDILNLTLPDDCVADWVVVRKRCNKTGPVGELFCYNHSGGWVNVHNDASDRFYGSSLYWVYEDNIGHTDNFTQGVEVNVANVSSGNTSKYQVWYLSCLASVNPNSSWLNSSGRDINNTPPIAPTNITCDGGNCNGTFAESIDVNCSGSTDLDNDTLTYYIDSYANQEVVHRTQKGWGVPVAVKYLTYKDGVKTSGADLQFYFDDVINNTKYRFCADAYTWGSTDFRWNCDSGYANCNSQWQYYLYSSDRFGTMACVNITITTGNGTNYVRLLNQDGDSIDIAPLIEINKSTSWQDIMEQDGDADGFYVWDISYYDPQSNVSLRCKTYDSDDYSPYYYSNTNGTIQRAPEMISARISPTSPYTNDTLLGYCNATDADLDNVRYYYRWYKDGVLNQSGVTSDYYTQATEINANNLSSSLTAREEVWKLSCLANDGTYNASSWVNSSTVTIQDTPPTTPTNLTCDGESCVDYVFDDNIELNCSGSTDLDNDTIMYDMQGYYNTTYLQDLQIKDDDGTREAFQYLYIYVYNKNITKELVFPSAPLVDVTLEVYAYEVDYGFFNVNPLSIYVNGVDTGINFVNNDFPSDAWGWKNKTIGAGNFTSGANNVTLIADSGGANGLHMMGIDTNNDYGRSWNDSADITGEWMIRAYAPVNVEGFAWADIVINDSDGIYDYNTTNFTSGAKLGLRCRAVTNPTSDWYTVPGNATADTQNATPAYGCGITKMQFRITNLTEQDLEPVGQNESCPILNVTNWGRQGGELRARMESALPSGIEMECDDVYNFASPLNMTITQQVIHSDTMVRNESQGIWCRIDLNNPTSGKLGQLLFELVE